MPICKICGKDSVWTVDVASKLCKECKKKKKLETQEKKDEEKKDEEKKQQFAEQQLIEREELKKEKQALSQKYTVLELYKGLAYVLMFVSTGLTIYSWGQLSDASKAMKKLGGGAAMDNALITLIVTYVITMFSLFCLTKMIDFLFDLDLNKSNK